MTTVSSGEFIRRRYQWTVPVPFMQGAVIGDVRDAIAMATTTYESVTGGKTSYDDWLRVSVTDEEVLFWFEVDEEPGTALPRKVFRALQKAHVVIDDLLQRNDLEDQWGVLFELKDVLKGASGGAS